MPTIIPTTSATDFNIDELTSGTLDGSGAFDILLKTYKAHLWHEYEKQRIRGTDYANAYVQLISQGLAQITGYTLDKTKLPLELQVLEAQVLKIGADTALTTKQGGLVDAQINKENAETQKIYLELEHKLPRELLLIDAQIRNMDREADLKEYELKYLKPLQLAMAEKELAIKVQQLGIAEKELAIKEQQLALAKFELEFKAPAEVKSINAQGDLYNQKVITEKAQTDASVINPDSVIARNNEVLKQQAISYINDGKLKATNMLVDTWKVRRNDDPDEAPITTNNLNDLNIAKAVADLMVNVGISQ